MSLIPRPLGSTRTTFFARIVSFIKAGVYFAGRIVKLPMSLSRSRSNSLSSWKGSRDFCCLTISCQGSPALLELRSHQEEALKSLAELRAQGITIALVTHAQGAGKTITAISDARRIGGRTLFVAHTRELVHQALDAFQAVWPDASTGMFLENDRQTEEHNVAGTVQSLCRHLDRFSPDDFEYLIVDERITLPPNHIKRFFVTSDHPLRSA